MKLYNILLFAVLLLLAVNVRVHSQCTTKTEKAFNLPLVDNSCVTYKARDEIVLSTGFTYKATSENVFDALIDEKLVFPVSYITSADLPLIDPELPPYPINVNIDKSLQIGTIHGEANVSATGAATYTIPISSSPGTAKMEPQISIVYNSQCRNGLLGIGWEMAGLSAITRAPQTVYTDGQTKGVNLNMGDRYALDGNRLLLLSGTTYGETGATYETQTKTFSKIESSGTVGNGPQYFTITTKDGKKLEYGNSDDSRAYALNATTPYMWRLNKITDFNGNYMVYTYKNINGQSVIDHIAYTGNDNTNPKLDPYNSIHFCYDKRDDVNAAYVGSYAITQNLILRTIKTFCEGNNVKTFTFHYNEGKTASKLTKITESRADGTKMNPTLIGWGDATDQVNYYHIPALNQKITYAGDFNGDGKTDLFTVPNFGSRDYTPNDRWSLDISYVVNGQFVSESIATGDLPDKFIPSWTKVGDINSDGLDDIVLGFKSGDGVYAGFIYYLSTGKNFTKIQSPFRYNNFKGIDVGDYNGDGKDEILVKHDDGISNWLVNYSWLKYENNSIVCYVSGSARVGEGESISTDIDGDGILEIVSLSSTYIIKFTGSGFEEIDSDLVPVKQSLIYLPADFNGDGKTDLLTFNATSSKWEVFFSRGASFINRNTCPISRTNNPVASTDRYIIGDYNGDGKSDILEYYEDPLSLTGYCYNIYYSKGSGFYKEEINFGYGILAFDMRSFASSPKKIEDFNGDGKSDLLLQLNGGIGSMIAFHPYEKSDLVTMINNGMNLNVSFSYKCLSEIGYNDGVALTFPLQKTTMPLNIVQTINKPGNINIDYGYSAAIIHKQGLGFLGFEQIGSFDFFSYQSILTSNTFDSTNYHLQSQKVEMESNLSTNIKTKTVVTEFTNQKIGNAWFSYPSVVTETDHLNGNTVTTTKTDYNGDVNGNIYSVSKDYGAGFTELSTYENYVNAGSWIPNKPQLIATTSKHPDDINSFSLKKHFTYDLNNGNLLTKTDNYQLSGKEVLTTYSEFNAFGQPQKVTTSPSGLVPQEMSFVYEPTKGRFLLSETNGLGTKKYQYEPIYGNLLKETGITGLSSTYTYNNWGSLIQTKFPDGNVVNKSVLWVPAGDEEQHNYAYYYTLTTSSGKPWSKTCYDILGRVIREETIGFKNVQLISDTQYDDIGRVSQKSSYNGGVLTNQVTYQYNDNDGRIESEMYLNGKTVTYSYSDKAITTVTDNKTYKKLFDNWGNVVKVTEPSPGGTIEYKYFSNGKPSQIITPASTVNMTYDEVGNQLTLIDPDAGTGTYQYDALSRLTYQKDNKGNEDYLSYDNMGRIDYKKNKNNEITDYEYYTSGDQIGLLKKETAPNGSSVSYEYDKFGRNTKTTQHVDATIGDLVYQYQYNTVGNMDKITYPNNYEITQTYDNFGNLTGVSNGTLPIWTLNDMNLTKMKYTLGNGQVTEKIFTANGFLTSIVTSKETTNGTVKAQMSNYDFNPVNGLLNWREDTHLGYSLKETFGYDDLYRLTGWTITKGGIQASPYTQTYKTDKSGNIDVKTGVGTYNYTGTQPHAITELATVTGNPVSQNDQVINYTDFNKINDITENGKKLTFMYGSAQERIKTEFSENGTLKKTMYYADLYEKKVISGGVSTEYCYIMAGDGLAAVYIKPGNSGGELNYVHKDHLGSIICITGSNGAIKEEYNYDPWGRRRNPADWSFTNVSAPTIINRGFTGHEHLEEFALINMNGRMYDPSLGLFLSPDNYVQSPDNTLNFNRYTYCMNNPLMYTDPSGNKWWHWLLGVGLDPGTIFTTATAMGSSIIASGSASLISQFATHAGSAGLNWVAGALDDGFSGGDKRAQNSWKISLGLYNADNENGGVTNQAWQVFSRFATQEPMTTLGYICAQGYNFFNRIDVDYFHGSTVIYDYDFKGSGAFSAGGYIFMDRYTYDEKGQTDTKRVTDYSNSMLIHEYGHFIQTRNWGGILTFYSSIISLYDADWNGSEVHKKLWVERDANARTLNYFKGRQGFEEGSINYNTFVTERGVGNIQYYDNRFWRWWYQFVPDPIFNNYYNVNNNPR